MLRAILRCGVKLGILSSAPNLPETFQSRDVPARRKASLSPAGDKRFEDYLTARLEEWDIHRFYVLYRLIRDTGISATAAIELRRRRDLDLAAGTIQPRERAGVYRKGTGPPVTIPDDLKHIINAWLPRAGRNFVVPNKGKTGPWRGKGHGGPFEELKRIALAAGIKSNITFGAVRRYHAEHVAPQPATSPDPSWPLIRLDGPGKPVFIDGKKKPPLRQGPYDVISALFGAGGGGLDEEKLRKRSGRGGWWRMLKALAADPDWARILIFPGAPWGRYRIEARRE
jgi:hypothetical protein